MRPIRWIYWAGLVSLLVSTPATGAPRHPVQRSASFIDNSGRMDINNLDMVVTNHGSIAYDLTTGNAGFVYPRGGTNTVVFAAGLWIGAKVGGDTRVALAEYTQEFTPGPMRLGTYQPDSPAFRCYRIERGGIGFADYLSEAVYQGAPTDAAGDPLVLGDATVWSVFNDADPSLHSNTAGSTAPLGVEIQQSLFAFNRPGPLENTIFVKWVLVNKGGNQLDSTFVSLWADPDLGGFTDDLVGCDTTSSTGFCYNATNSDLAYGSTPPAVGFTLIRGPVVAAPGGGSDTLGATSFVKYINGTDPMSAQEVFNTMCGRHTDGSPIFAYDNPLDAVTTFEVSGDPVANTGWLDTAPADRRLLLTTGPFSFAPLDTQIVIYALCVGQGADRLASVDDLRSTIAVARTSYDLEPAPTAVSATLLEADAHPDRVRLSWVVPGAADLIATVARREPQTEWALLGSAAVEGSDRLGFEDATVSPGMRYQYRLLLRERTGEESAVDSWVDVPAEAAPSTPALRFRAANPTGGPTRVEYGIPVAGSLRLDVYDARGAKVASLRRGSESAGWREASWDGRDRSGRLVPSGIYFVRLESSSCVVARKLVVAR